MRTIATRAWAAFAAVCIVAAAPAAAGDSPLNILPVITEKSPERMFFFGGVDAGSDSYFSWSGIAGAPIGHLADDGPRFRVMAGAGRYRYRTAAVPGGANHGNSLAGEVMIGWRSRFDATVFTAYLGGHAEHHRLDLPDPGNPVAGTKFGVKAAVELYARLEEGWIASFSASGSSVNLGYAARAVVARENPAGYSLGTEAALFGDERYHEWRAGMLAAAVIDKKTFTLAGGYLDNSDRGGGGYLALSIYAAY